MIDWLIDLARRSGHRLMVRLVKGAYWDGEIKRAQVDGLEGFPVFTRKLHTDVSYIACARKLLAATDVVFPQFATHNALTLATIHAMAGPDFQPGQYEFQCLHGMGESLYEEVVGPDKLDRPCRIYAPVGTHETLAGLSRPPPAGERRQHLVRQPDRRSDVSDRQAARRSGRARAPPRSGRACRIRGSPCRAICSAPSAPIRRASTSATSSAWPRSPPRSTPADLARDADAWATARARARRARCAIPPTSRDVVGSVVEATPELVDAACARAIRAWTATPQAARRRACCASPTALEARTAAVGRPDRARGRQDLRQRRRRGARGGRFPALLRRPGARPGRTTPTSRWASSPASARGTSRCRSSPARSPARSRRAMR